MALQMLQRMRLLLNLPPENHEYDELLQMLSEDVQTQVAAYTNTPPEQFPASYPGIIANMAAFQFRQQQQAGKQSESLGNYSVSYANVTDYPSHITKGLKRRLSW